MFMMGNKRKTSKAIRNLGCWEAQIQPLILEGQWEKLCTGMAAELPVVDIEIKMGIGGKEFLRVLLDTDAPTGS
jgi:hypothetical protein